MARVGLPAAIVDWRGTGCLERLARRERDESALFFTGDENLVELAGVVEYRFAKEGVPA